MGIDWRISDEKLLVTVSDGGYARIYELNIVLGTHELLVTNSGDIEQAQYFNNINKICYFIKSGSKSNYFTYNKKNKKETLLMSNVDVGIGEGIEVTITCTIFSTISSTTSTGAGV